MAIELKDIEKVRAALKEDDYRFLVAKIAIFHLKGQTKNKTDLYTKVNGVLLSKNLAPISFGFIRNNI
ncbi:hypothetical protein [Bacillus mycoides]|uniref:hypothetical protein n=1 Tax=Bacillus mycoides TaxID=1405 RepID=UPI001C02CB49|nr:hypothetical protein [Bacillus mycoides]QWH95536.1 hypothetical protein EXW36_02745 [Bacillus mycoides]